MYGDETWYAVTKYVILFDLFYVEWDIFTILFAPWWRRDFYNCMTLKNVTSYQSLLWSMEQLPVLHITEIYKRFFVDHRWLTVHSNNISYHSWLVLNYYAFQILWLFYFLAFLISLEQILRKNKRKLFSKKAIFIILKVYFSYRNWRSYGLRCMLFVFWCMQ